MGPARSLVLALFAGLLLLGLWFALREGPGSATAGRVVQADSGVSPGPERGDGRQAERSIAARRAAEAGEGTPAAQTRTSPRGSGSPPAGPGQVEPCALIVTVTSAGEDLPSGLYVYAEAFDGREVGGEAGGVLPSGKRLEESREAELPHLPPEIDLVVQVQAPGATRRVLGEARVEALTSGETRRLEVPLFLVEAWSLNGIVQGPDGGPQAGVLVECWRGDRLEALAEAWPPRLFSTTLQTRTDEAGAFSFVLEGPERALLCARDAGSVQLEPVFATPRAPEVLVQLTAGAGFRGRVLPSIAAERDLRESFGPDAAEPQRTISVLTVYDARGLPVAHGNSSRDGSYELTGLLPGRYTLVASRPGLNPGAATWIVRSASVDLAAGEVAEQDLEFDLVRFVALRAWYEGSATSARVRLVQAGLELADWELTEGTRFFESVPAQPSELHWTDADGRSGVLEVDPGSHDEPEEALEVRFGG